MKKAILLLATILLTGVLLISCHKTEEPDISMFNNVDISGIEYPVIIGEFKISMEEYAYYFFRTKESIERYRNETWEKEASRADLKAETLSYLTRQYTIRKMANNYGLSLNQNDQQRINQDIRAMETEKGGPEAFKRFLEESHLTEELLRHIKGADILEEKLLASFSEEETPEQVAERLNATWFRTQHIMIEVGEKYNEEKRREFAQSLYERAAAGEDFTELVEKYNEDPDRTGEYFFALDDRRLSYEDNVLELEPGQISEVFWSDGSFYIIKRLPLTDEQILQKSEEVRSRGSYETFGILFDTVRQSLKITVDPRYELIDVDTMK